MTATANAALIWATAELLRGDYKQSDYGKVILPFTLLRRLDCVLAPTKALFREAERRVRARFPHLHAEAIIATSQPAGPRWCEVQLPACIAAARQGLAGINILPDPYDDEMDWAPVSAWAPQAAAAGLGITAHAGEFSAANLAAALHTPGLTRVGHAVYATENPRLLEQLVQSGVTVECSLTCNVVLGATSSYADHPIRAFVAAGIPVTLSTDDPVRVATTIGREYAIAAALGFSADDLRGFTWNAVAASFAPTARRTTLLDVLTGSAGASSPITQG